MRHRRTYPHYPALRRPGAASTSGYHTTVTPLYARAPLLPVAPFEYASVPPYRFRVTHDLRRCWPFGVFDVAVSTATASRVPIGAQLSYPSHDDCWRLLGRHRAAQAGGAHGR